MDEKIIKQCYQKSVELLLENSTDFGILASSSQKNATVRNYLSVFARDSSICALGIIASGNKKLIKTARNSLLTLAAHQAENGQIPNYVKPETGYVDFWKIGCIDATMWWLIALKHYDNHLKNKTKLESKLRKKVDKAIGWLFSQEHGVDRLVTQNEASDWADLMPRSGKVLYSNALWLKVKSLYGLSGANKTKKSFNNLFYPFGVNPIDVPRCEQLTIKAVNKNKKPTEHYLSFVNYLFWGRDIDVYGNSLAIIFKLANKEMNKRIIGYLLRRDRKNVLPIPVLFNPIKKNSKLWRDYMKSYNQNYPYQYHNGGIWPYAACFWSMALVRAGYKKEAREELEKIAKANSLNNWRFSEWLHGKTGKPRGMAGQSWNAGAFILAYHYFLKPNIF